MKGGEKMNEIKGFTALTDIEMVQVDGGSLLSVVLGPILSPIVNVNVVVITRK
jgi:hypothetical protein